MTTVYPWPTSPPAGSCRCGCGRPTPIAKRTRRYLGHIKGQPTAYVVGHGPQTGKPIPEERRQRIASTLLGHSVSEEARAKMGSPGPTNPRWRGGRTLTSTGYVEVWLPEDHPFATMRNPRGRVREHRLVMAHHLGRPLAEEETVHHINDQRDDNRLENLMLFPTRGAHSAFHRARELA